MLDYPSLNLQILFYADSLAETILLENFSSMGMRIKFVTCVCNYDMKFVIQEKCSFYGFSIRRRCEPACWNTASRSALQQPQRHRTQPHIDFTLYPFLRHLDGPSRFALTFFSRRHANDTEPVAFLSRTICARESPYIYIFFQPPGRLVHQIFSWRRAPCVMIVAERLAICKTRIEIRAASHDAP